MPEIRFNPILSPQTPVQKPMAGQGAKEKSDSFADILSDALDGTGGVKFSKHAKTRLESRNIALSQNDLEKLDGAVDAASKKGVKDTLVMMNGLAFIVNVPDRTVVTAMPVSESADVFTNIDGAVIA